MHLYDYIKNQYDLGKGDKEIESILTKNGYTPEIARSHIETFRTLKNRGKPNKKSKPMIFIAIAFSIVILLLLIFFNPFSEKITPISEEGLSEVSTSQLNVKNGEVTPETTKTEKEYPACTSSAWFCSSFGDCSESGQRTRTCILEDSNCLNPEDVKPTTTQSCTPPIQKESVVIEEKPQDNNTLDLLKNSKNICNKEQVDWETQPGQCNAKFKPFYCDGGTGDLTLKCSVCGCDGGLECKEDENCYALAVCGDGFIGDGENSNNCCADVGCPDGRACNANNQCAPFTAECNALVDNGENTIKAIFISDGYGDNNLPAFAKDVDNVIDQGFYTVEPYKSYKNSFSFYSVYTGFELGCGYIGNAIDPFPNKYTACNKKNAIKLAETCFPYDSKTDISVLVVNQPQPGYPFGEGFMSHGTGTRPLSILHEYSHTYGLTDEYILTSPTGELAISSTIAPNCDVEGCPKWCSGQINTQAPCYQKIQEYNQCLENSDKTGVECLVEIDPENPFSGDLITCDIGIECEEETACIFMCGGPNGYRQTESSLMNDKAPYLSPASRDTIIQVINERLG